METKNLYMWGNEGLPIDKATVETLQHFLNRKNGVFTPLTEEQARLWLKIYQNKQSPELKFFIGTQAEFDKYKETLPVITMADKGQMGRVIEAGYNLVANYSQDQINGAMWGRLVNPSDISFEQKFNLYVSWKIRAEAFNTDLALLLLGKIDKVEIVDELGLEAVLADMKHNAPISWGQYVALVNAEIAMEPADVITELKKVLSDMHESISQKLAANGNPIR